MRGALAALISLGIGSAVFAQRGPAKADVTPILEVAQARAGTSVHAALQVHLPEGYHTNSNKPRDPTLIPITLTLAQPPPGITFNEIVFPPPTDLAQRGADQPLRVFDGDFVIGVALTIAADAQAGAIPLPARLRYQACDEVACYIPATVPITWTLTVAKTASPKQHQEIFRKIAFGTGEGGIL